MKKLFRVWIGFLALCVLMSLSPLSAFAAGSYQEFFAVAHSNLYQDAFPIHLYKMENALYIDGVTLAGISGYEQTGEREFTLGGRTVSPAYSSKFAGTWGFPMERTLDRFGVRMFEKDGELYFLSGRDALRVLFEADSASWRYRSLLDPDDAVNTLGASLSYAKDFLMSWDLRPVLESYRNAMYKLVQEDMDETTFSSLQKKWESGVNKPISTTFSFLEAFMEEDEIDAFYAGSELMQLKSYMDGVKLEEKVLGRSLSAYYRRLEEIGLLFDTNVHALRAMEYAAEADGAVNQMIVRAAKDVLRSANMKTEGWDARLISQLAWEHVVSLFHSTSANLMKEMMLGKKNLALLVVKTILNRIPVISFMSNLEEAYAFAEIQQFFESEMILADVDGDWLKFKYMAIMYYRCFYASCGALRNADMKDMVLNWEEQIDAFREAAMEQIAALAGVPDSALEPFLANSIPVNPFSLRLCNGPEADYSQLAPYTDAETEEGELPAAVLQGVKQAWAAMCSQYGQVSLANYGGELYVNEGDGAVLPLLSQAEDEHFLIVLVQQGETLAQFIFRVDPDGSYKQVCYDRTLTLGDRATLFLYERSGSALIASASLEDDLAAFAAAAPRTVEKRLFQGDEMADSIAAMGEVPWEAFETLYGSPEWSVRVDANYGLFHLQVRDPQQLQSLFDISIP